MNLKDITIKDVVNVSFTDISDEVYFSSSYKDYISNSRLSLINPDEGGSPQKYRDGLSANKIYAAALTFGDAVHKMFLQPEDYTVNQDIHKPNDKLGNIVDYILDNKLALTVDSVKEANSYLNAYVNCNDSRAENIIESIKEYYDYALIKGISPDQIYLTEFDKHRLSESILSLKGNHQIKEVLNDNWVKVNEGTCLISVNVEVPMLLGTETVTLHLKGKLDNICYNEDTVIVNDLKTTSNIKNFNRSVEKYHYKRQMGLYTWFLKHVFPSAKNTGCNILVVSSKPPYESTVVKMSLQDIKDGLAEAASLIKRVAYHTVYGFNAEPLYE